MSIKKGINKLIVDNNCATNKKFRVKVKEFKQWIKSVRAFST